MAISKNIFLALSLFVLLSGCTRGWLYSDVVQPVTVNMKDTPNSIDLATGRTIMLSEPFTAPGLRIEWATLGIGDVGKKANMDPIYYADLHTFSILGNIFRLRKIRVYGNPPAEKVPTAE